MGEPCKNSGCKNTYLGPEESYTNCKHHPGIPVFHEGKYNPEIGHLNFVLPMILLKIKLLLTTYIFYVLI